jgi:hypothetical protein
MHKRFPVLVGAVLFGLSACVDTEMNLNVSSATHGSITGHIQVQRAMFDMSGGDDSFCPGDEGGVLTVTEAHARCEVSMEGSFAELIKSDDAATSPRIIDMKDGTVRVTYPLQDMTSEMGDMGTDPQMLAMFRPMLEGGRVVIRVTGAQIVSSSGTISADGRSAEIGFDLTDLIDNPDAIPSEFVSIVRY